MLYFTFHEVIGICIRVPQRKWVSGILCTVTIKKINKYCGYLWYTYVVLHQNFALITLSGIFPFCYVCFCFYIKNKHKFTGKVPYESVLLLCIIHTIIYLQYNRYPRFKITGKTYNKVTCAAWHHFIYCMFTLFYILRKGFQLFSCYITKFVQNP